MHSVTFFSYEDSCNSFFRRALKAVKNFRFGVENRHGIFKFVKDFVSSASAFSNDLFFETFLNAIENEKDPRNLMIIFDSINCLSKFPLSVDYIEEFFESVFCYFPITFRSNPSDPNLITVEELKASLARAISGDSRFGDLAVPLLIEKLSSNSTSAKIDSLDVLLKASNIYDPISFVQFRYQLEISLFSEIIANSDSKIQAKSLELVRKMVKILPEEEAENWMNKFLREAIAAIELDSREIISKSAILIESISSSSDRGFKFSLNFCMESLIKLSINETWSIKGQVARNCLVALFSPLKSNPQWKEHFSNTSSLNDLFTSTNQLGNVDSFCVYLVIFSFISSLLSQEVANSFISKFLQISTDTDALLSVELKNCIWLASKSCPSAFIAHIPFLENDQILSAIASTPELTQAALNRLIQLNRISAIEEVIIKGDLSIVKDDLQLTECLLSSPIDPVPMVKLFSHLEASNQTIFLIKMPSNLEILLIGARPEVIERLKQDILKETPKFTNPNTITSLYNKCPNLWDQNCFSSPELSLAACKGLIYRMDPRGLNILKEKFEEFDAESFAKMFQDESEIFSSSETFHKVKGLHLQWFLNWLLVDEKDFNCVNKTILLISLLSASKSLIHLYSTVLPELILNFLTTIPSAKVDSNVLKSAWEVLVELVNDKSSEHNVDSLITLALEHSKLEKEPLSVIRYWSLKLLCRLIENPLTRADCQRWQQKVILELKNFNDPKRSVRQEAARANNLWIVLLEDGVFN